VAINGHRDRVYTMSFKGAKLLSVYDIMAAILHFNFRLGQALLAVVPLRWKTSKI